MGNNFPGKELKPQVPYNFEGIFIPDFMKKTKHCLRTKRIAQPKVLVIGDILATGQRVQQNPRLSEDFRYIYLKLSDNPEWIRVPKILPIALHLTNDVSLGSNYALPKNLEIGDLLPIGHKVISDPCTIEGQIGIHLDMGKRGRWRRVPPHIPIALMTLEDADGQAPWLFIPGSDAPL